MKTKEQQHPSWEDITEECEWVDETHDFKAYIQHKNREIACTLESSGYRLRKVGPGAIEVAAFIVEKLNE